MADQLRKLKRRQLLELLVSQGRELETARQQLAEAQARAAELEDRLGKITAAGLAAAEIVEQAKREAEAYVDARKAEAEQEGADIEKHAEREAEEIMEHARRLAEGYVDARKAEAEQQAQQILAQAQDAAKAETKPETKAETKPEATPEVKPGTKPGVKRWYDSIRKS